MTATRHRDPTTGLRPAAVVVGLALLALALRIPGLGGGLWLDEIGTLLNFVRPPLAEIASDYSSPNNHVLYSLLSHVSIAVFGESAWALRLPAFLFGGATVPLMYLLVRSWLTEREAIGVSLVVAASYHHVYFSQNARGYTGLVFLTVLAVYLLARAMQSGSRGFWIGFAVVSALNVYLLLSGLFVTVSLVFGAVVLQILPGSGPRYEGRPILRPLAGATALAAVLTLVLYAPLLGEMFEFYTTVDADVGWLPGEGLLGVLLSSALPSRSPVVVGIGVVIGVPVAAAGTVRIIRRAPLAPFAFLLPPLIELGVAVALGAGSYPRRFILLLPLAAMVGVSGVHSLAEWLAARVRGARLSPSAFAVGVGIGICAVAWQLPRLYRLPMQDFHGALSYVDAQREDGDVVAATWIAVPPVQYYRPSVRSARTVVELEAILEVERNVWLLATMLEDLRRREPELHSLLRRRFREVRRFEGLVGDGAVVVFRSTG